MVTDCERTARRVCSNMPGKTDVDGLIHLCEMVKGLEVDGWLIDLGTYEGRSAMLLALSDRGRKVVSIDNYQEGPNAKEEGGPYPDFWKVRKRFKCMANAYLVVGESSDVPAVCRGQNIALVFVDTTHTRERLIADIEAWKPLVVEGGLMAFDDYGSNRWPDVQPTVDEMMADWEALGVRGKVAVFRRSLCQ